MFGQKVKRAGVVVVGMVVLLLISYYQRYHLSPKWDIIAIIAGAGVAVGVVVAYRSFPD